MHKTKLFAHILDLVSQATDIRPDVILSCSKCEDAVDARYILVHLLSQQGLYSSHISQLMGCSHRNINKMLSRFHSRAQGRRLLRINLEAVKNAMGTTME